MFNAISWAIFGFLAGAVAKWLIPGNDPKGCIVTTVLGIIGAMLGGYIGVQIGWGTVEGWDFRSFGLAVAGAIILLFIHRAVTQRKA